MICGHRIGKFEDDLEILRGLDVDGVLVADATFLYFFCWQSGGKS